MKKNKINLWQVTTVVFAVLFLLAIFNIFSFTGSTTKVTGAVTFINEYLLDGVEATVADSKEEHGMTLVTLSIEGQPAEIYLSPDGKLLFPPTAAISLEENQDNSQQNTPQQTTAPQDIPKSEKPEVELFIMSHCPYGTQMEKGMYPVVNLLKDKIDFDLKFVSYAMHGKVEVNEQLNQYCIDKEQNDKLMPYLKCFLEAGDGEGCLTETGIDMNTLTQCTIRVDEEFDITTNLEDQSLWLNGRFPLFNIHEKDNKKYGVQGSPTLVINEQVASTGRDSVSLLNTICNAFNVAPEECNTELEAGSPSPGFGWSGSGTSNIATCGG